MSGAEFSSNLPASLDIRQSNTENFLGRRSGPDDALKAVREKITDPYELKQVDWTYLEGYFGSSVITHKIIGTEQCGGFDLSSRHAGQIIVVKGPCLLQQAVGKGDYADFQYIGFPHGLFLSGGDIIQIQDIKDWSRGRETGLINVLNPSDVVLLNPHRKTYGNLWLSDRQILKSSFSESGRVLELSPGCRILIPGSSSAVYSHKSSNDAVAEHSLECDRLRPFMNSPKEGNSKLFLRRLSTFPEELRGNDSAHGIFYSPQCPGFYVSVRKGEVPSVVLVSRGDDTAVIEEFRRILKGGTSYRYEELETGKDITPVSTRENAKTVKGEAEIYTFDSPASFVHFWNYLQVILTDCEFKGLRGPAR